MKNLITTNLGKGILSMRKMFVIKFQMMAMNFVKPKTIFRLRVSHFMDFLNQSLRRLIHQWKHIVIQVVKWTKLGLTSWKIPFIQKMAKNKSKVLLRNWYNLKISKIKCQTSKICCQLKHYNHLKRSLPLIIGFTKTLRFCYLE